MITARAWSTIRLVPSPSQSTVRPVATPLARRLAALASLSGRWQAPLGLAARRAARGAAGRGYGAPLDRPGRRRGGRGGNDGRPWRRADLLDLADDRPGAREQHEGRDER